MKRQFKPQGASGTSRRRANQQTRLGFARQAARAHNLRIPVANRQVINKETGYVDTGVGAFNNSTTGTISLVATIPQGTTVNTRVGKKILYKSLQIRGRINSGSTSTLCDAANLLVYDKRPTGVLPAITDILDSVSDSSFNNDANSGRFVILRRWDYTLSGNTATPTTGNEVKDISEYVDLKGLPAVFKAAGTGAIADYEEGPLYFISVGGQAAGTTAAGTTVNMRIRFVDV